MLKIERILIPLDLNKPNEDIVSAASEWVKFWGATELHFIYVLPVQVPVSTFDAWMQASLPAQDFEGLRLDAEVSFDAIRQKLGDFPAQVVTKILYDVNVAHAILQYADDAKMDLVMMETHGRKGLERFLMGSVAETVVQKVHTPVLTMHPPFKAPNVKTILVPTDFSTHAQTALIEAGKIAQTAQAQIRLLHIVLEEGMPPYYDPYWKYLRGKEAMRGRIYRLMNNFLRQSGVTDVPVQKSIRFGNAASEIVTFAEKEHCDLIVLPTHGLTGLAHLLMGSVAEQVTRKAPVPVLTLKSHPQINR